MGYNKLMVDRKQKLIANTQIVSSEIQKHIKYFHGPSKGAQSVKGQRELEGQVGELLQ